MKARSSAGSSSSASCTGFDATIHLQRYIAGAAITLSMPILASADPLFVHAVSYDEGHPVEHPTNLIITSCRSDSKESNDSDQGLKFEKFRFPCRVWHNG